MVLNRAIILMLVIQLFLARSAYGQEVNSVENGAGSTQAATPAYDLDLSSTQRSVAASSVMAAAAQATIDLAGVSKTISPTDMLTAAEMVAVRQVLNTGQQYLQLNELGAAVGGGLRLNYHAAAGLGNLVIPAGVHASQNAALLQSLNLSGNFTNSGTFSVYSSNPAVSTAAVNATNIYNNASGLITSALANFNLNAINDIVNAGTITSSGNLNLTAGNSIVNAGSAAMLANNISMLTNNIVNSGTMAALTGNLNIASQMAQNLTVNNVGGLLQALNGNINVRDPSYSGPGNIDLIGGDYLSRELNLYAGTGTATVSVGQVTGQVNTYAGAEHISADTALLNLGNNISSDPTYYNTGSIRIVGTMSSNEGLAIVAGGDITADTNGQIVTNGNNLLMIAGANITSACSSCTSPGPGTVGPTSGGTPTSGLADGTVTVSLAGGSGGNIDLSSSTAAKVIDTSSGTSAGGKVTLVALADGFGAKGQVLLNNGSNLGEINTSGSGSGGGGDVTVYAGSSFFGLITSINTNKIETISSGTLNSGSVTLQTTQAVTSNGQPLILDNHGAIISGNTIQPGATLSQAGISYGFIDTEVKGGSQAGGNVTIKAYGDINAKTSIKDTKLTYDAISTINNGVGAAGEVSITSSNGSVSTGVIASFVYSGWLAAANVTISAYGNITTNGNILYAFQGGSGAGGTITLTSTNGTVSTGALVVGVGDTVAAGNVIISAYGNITTEAIAAFNVGTGGGGTVTLTSSNGAIVAGLISTNTNLGLVPAGNVTLSAFGNITVAEIDASNAGISTGGSVTLLTLGSLTVGDINTSSNGSLGGKITAAAAGNNGSYSIVLADLQTSGVTAAGSVEVVSTDIFAKPNLIGIVTAQASGQSGVGGAVGIATRGGLTVGDIDTTNTATSASTGAQSGSVFLSSGSTATDAILAGNIKAYNQPNGSASGQVILIASGTIGVLGTITTSSGNSLINPSYTSLTSSISSSTTITLSVAGISGNYNPQGYLSISGSSTQLTINTGNSSLLAPLLCFGAVSIASINAQNGTQADGVALVAIGNITLSGSVGVNTSGTTSGGNVNLLSITGQISVDGLATSSSGAGTAGNLSVTAPGFINIGGAVNTSNSGTGAGGTVTIISSNNSVSVGEIDTHVTAGSGSSGTVSISAYQGINTNGNAIEAFNAGTGSGGTVYLVSSIGSVSAGEINTYVSSGSATAGSVVIEAVGSINTNSNSIFAYNGGTGSSGSVILSSSNNFITTGAIDTHVTSGSQKAADVTLSAYGNITISGALNAANTGSGSGSTINLLTATGSVTTGGINVNVSTASIIAGNVNIEASGAINTSAGTIQAKNGGTRPIGSGVTLLSHTNSVTTNGIDISVDAGSAALAGNVSIAASSFVSVGAKIDASNNGTGSGGTVTLVSSGSTVTASDIDTYVKSSSKTAGDVSISAFGFVNVAGATDASNGGLGASGAGSAGTVTLLSDNGNVTTGAIKTNVSAATATAGFVTILADGTITTNGTINASNAGTGTAGAIALTSATGSVSIGGIQTYVAGGSAAAGNVIISAPGAIAVTGAVATNNTGTGAGGSVALITNSTISLSTITTSGTPSGSVFLSSGASGTGAIATGAITLAGGTLLATAAKTGSITVQSYTDGNTLSVNAGQIFATGTYTSAVNILPLAFTNSATVTITPAIIPGGGFTSFSNTGTITLANDAGSSGNVITFNVLLPVFVQGTVSSLGTINDSTGQSNFFVVAPTVSINSNITYTSTIGSLSILADSISIPAINTNGVNLSLTAVQSITTGAINTRNSGGTAAGNARLLSVLGSVTTDTINTYITSGQAQAGNVTISAYGNLSTSKQAINASNLGTGAGGTVNITTSGTGSVEVGQIDTSINNASSNSAAGNITILAAAAIGTTKEKPKFNASNLGSGAGGTLALVSETYSITTSDIDTHVASGLAPSGNVFISALQSIITGNINTSHAGSGTGGNVTFVRAAAMATADVDTSSTGSTGGSIIAGAVGDNNDYTLSMGNLKTSGFNAAGSIMLIGDDFGAKPLIVGTITAQATGPSGIGGAVGISALGTVEVGAIDTTNTAAAAVTGAQSGSVFLSSGSNANNALTAGNIKAHNQPNGSAPGQVILIASGAITSGTITTTSGNSKIAPNYTSNLLSITSSTTVDVSVAGIALPSSNYNPKGYAALSGDDTVLTINSGGNSLLLAPLVFTAFVPMAIKSINSNSHTAADSIALLVFGNLTLSDTVGINASGTTSGGNVIMQSSAGQISINSIATNSSGSGAAGSINISAWMGIPITGTIDASNSGTGAGGSVFLASTDNSVATGEIKTSVTNGSAPAGNVTVVAYAAMSIEAINASNTGTGAGGTVFLTSSNSLVTTGAINTTAASGAAGKVYISAFGAINTSTGAIQAYNTGTGAGGAVALMSTNDSVVTGAINTYAGSGSAAAGNVSIWSSKSITLGGNIASYNTGLGAGGTVTLSAWENIRATATTVTVTSPTIKLMATTGNIGTSNIPIATVCTGTLTVQAFGSVYITQTGALSLLGSQIGGSFQLTSSGQVNIASNSTAGSLNFTSTGLVINQGVGLMAGSTAAITASSVTLSSSSSISAGGNIAITSPSGSGLLVTNNGTLSSISSPSNFISIAPAAGNDLTINGNGAMNSANVVYGLNSSSTVTSRNLTIGGVQNIGGNLGLFSSATGFPGAVNVSANAVYTASGGIIIDTPILNNSGTLQANGTVTPNVAPSPGAVGIFVQNIRASAGVSFGGNGSGVMSGSSIYLQSLFAPGITFTASQNFIGPVTMNDAGNNNVTINAGVTLTATAGNGQISVVSPSGLNLNISGGGTILAPVVVLTATAPGATLNFSGSISLSGGPTWMSATGGTVTIAGVVNHNSLIFYNAPGVVPAGWVPASGIIQMSPTVAPPGVSGGAITIYTDPLVVNGTIVGVVAPSPPAPATPTPAPIEPQTFPFNALAAATVASIDSSAGANGSTAIISVDSTPGATSNGGVVGLVQADQSRSVIGLLPPAAQSETGQGASNWHSDGSSAMYCADCMSSIEPGNGQPGITPIQSMGNHDFCVLSRGVAFFTPSRSLQVQTQEGMVHVDNGAQAFVIETGHDVAIYNLHDSHHGGISIVVEKRSIRVPLGKQLVLTRKPDATFDQVNPGESIASRNPQKLDFGNGVTGFIADFSILSAIANIAPLRAMLTSDKAEVQKLSHLIIKNAAIMATVSSASGPYKTSK